MMRDLQHDDDDDNESYATTVEHISVIRGAGASEVASSNSASGKSAGGAQSWGGAARMTGSQKLSASPPGMAGTAEQQQEEQQPSNSTSSSFFVWDNAKPWWTFGSGIPDKSAGPTWVPDESVTQCTNCSKTFDFFNRKHHCRHCGLIFCNGCSSYYRLLPVEFGVREPQRCCGECAAELGPLQDELAKTISNQTRQLAFDPNSPSKYLNAPVSFSMTAEISKAAHTVENIFGYVPNSMIVIDRQIPEQLIRQAKAIAFLTVLKGGFLVSGKIGTGLIIAKLEHEQNGSVWSAPSAIGTMGIGWGAQVGGEITDFVIVLTTKDALETFSGSSQVAVGAELGISVGPFGRTGEASLNFGDRGLAPVYAYSQSSGLFAGVSLEGAVITARSDVNRRFYGKDYTPKEILSGAVVSPPRAAQPLYEAVQKVFSPNLRASVSNMSTGSVV